MKISKWVILTTIFCSFIACAKQANIAITTFPSPDMPPTPDDSSDSHENTPSISIRVTSPDDLLYVAPKNLKDWDTIAKPTLYTASGDGGLGVDFNDRDKLAPFSGIPLLIESKNIEPHSQKVTLSAEGHPLCPSLFKLNQSQSLITIDATNIKGLVTCSIKIQATASSDDNVAIAEHIFQVTMNPTLAFYAAQNSNEPILRYLKVYSGSSHNQNIITIASWLKTQAGELNLSFDQEILNGAAPLENINALTGLKSLQSLNLSKTDLNNLSALSYFQHLQNLNLSGTKIRENELEKLGLIPSLAVLNVSHLDIRNIAGLVQTHKTLNELDLSENENITDFNQLAHFTNLKKLTLAKMNLKHIHFLENVPQISHLNISENLLSKVDEADLATLSRLSQLENLDISKAQLPDDFLSRLFPSLTGLKRFVDANKYEREDFDKATCATKMNNFEAIPQLSDLKNLEYIDIHGNACNIAKQPYGLKNTAYFSKSHMGNLRYLDISNTAVSNLEHLQDSNLETLHIVHHPIDAAGHMIDEGAIPMTQATCKKQLQNKTIAAECISLSEGQWKSQIYTNPGTYQFTIPNPAKFYSISVTACSGGDGGQGGQGGQGGYAARHVFFDKTSDEWVSYPKKRPPAGADNVADSYFIASEKPGLGKAGAMGGTSYIRDVFQTTQEHTTQSYNGYCGAGKGGEGGRAGSVGNHDWKALFQVSPLPVNGIAGADGYSKKVSNADFSVIPGQVLTIIVGQAGTGGDGTGPAKNGFCSWDNADKIEHSYSCGTNGEVGQRGGNATPGYVEIRWLEL